MPKNPHLTPKQRAFIEAYDGNATEAARKAGYSSPNQASFVLMRDERIKEGIHKREEREQRTAAAKSAAVGRILSRAERQAWWTSVILDTDDAGKPMHEMKDRLKASELLGRSEADFTEKLQHEAGKSFAEMVLESCKGK